MIDTHEAGPDLNTAEGLLDYACGILTSAGEGTWTEQTPEWRRAAHEWAERYHQWLREQYFPGEAGEATGGQA